MAEPKYPYPSRFGSHKEMVVREEDNSVICEDEFGEYKTSKDRLDNGLADVFRYSSKRLKEMFQGRKEENE